MPDDDVWVIGIGMFVVEVLLASHLVLTVVDVPQHVRDQVFWKAFVLSEDFVELVLGIASEGTTEVGVSDGFGALDDLGTTVGRVGDASRACGSVSVSDVVSVVGIEVLDPSELGLPEGHGVFQLEPDAFEEETVLESASVS